MRTAKAAGMIAMLAAIGSSGTDASETTASPIEARALIALTRETRATYTIVGSTLIYLPDGTQVREWAAEFHDGIHHRVETPRDRAIADCEAMTGVHLNVTTVEVAEEAGVALAACGVQAHSKILSTRLGGMRQTRFGPATHLVIVDETDIRTYDVAPDGALLNATITGRDGTKKLVMRAVYYAAEVPVGIFMASSLAKSAVPAHLRGPDVP